MHLRGYCFSALLLSAVLVQSAAAQFTGIAPTTAPGLNVRPTLTTDPSILYPPERDFTLMPGDLLTVDVYGVTPAYSDRERVGQDGSVRLNLGGILPVSGLTLKQAEAAIAARFEQEQTFHNAQVQLQVLEAPAHVATVIGAIKGVVPIIGHMPLYEVLSRVGTASGGLPTQASTVINIQRPVVSVPIVVDIGNDAMHNASGNIPIFAGDTISVGTVGSYYVVGAVNRPGQNALNGSVPTTVLQAISSAGGTTFPAKPDEAQLIRFTGGRRSAMSVPLKKIQDGKAEDVALQTDDIILVPTSALKSAIKNGGISTVIAVALAYATVTSTTNTR